MTAPLVIDLFCGAGGATRGYWMAGFRVLGVDIEPQPSYCGELFIQADVMTLDLTALVKLTGAVFVHASPPCQRASQLRSYQPATIDARYPDLIAPVREKLEATREATGVQWVIENVPGAALIEPVMLCGAMFPGELRVYRHRGFEASFPLHYRQEPVHVARCTRNGYLPVSPNDFMTVTGGKHSRAWQRAACEAMGTPWMAVRDGENTKAAIRNVCEAIPPLYTREIARDLFSYWSQIGRVAA